MKPHQKEKRPGQKKDKKGPKPYVVEWRYVLKEAGYLNAMMLRLYGEWKSFHKSATLKGAEQSMEQGRKKWSGFEFRMKP